VGEGVSVQIEKWKKVTVITINDNGIFVGFRIYTLVNNRMFLVVVILFNFKG
jgi:hypothetical protein|tara:strand:- start:1860 stop:2015 length:156 start_codon:yes stop_codon:yes gene_type:complete